MNFATKGLFIFILKGTNVFASFFLSILIARILGANIGTDALFVAMILPITIAQSLPQLLSISLIPNLVAQSREKQKELLSHFMGWWLIIMALVVAVCIGFSETLIKIISPGMSENAIDNAARYLTILAPAFLFLGTFAVGQATMNAMRKFYMPELAMGINRALSIIAILTLGVAYGPEGFCYGLTGAAAAQVAVVMILCRGAGVSLLAIKRPDQNLELMKPIIKNIITVLIILAFRNGRIVMERIFASYMESGHISVLTYADRIAKTMPLLLAGSFLSVFLPDISEVWKKQGNVRELMGNFSTFVFALSFPLAILLFWSADILVQQFFSQGKMPHEMLPLLSGTIRGFSLGIPAIVCGMGLRVTMFLERKIRPILFFVVVMLLVNFCFCISLFRFGATGIAYACSATEWVIVGYLLFKNRVVFPSFGMLSKILVYQMLFSLAILGVPWATFIRQPLVKVTIVGTVLLGSYYLLLGKFFGKLMQDFNSKNIRK